MATGKRKSTAEDHGEAKYPYTTKPGSLRKLLALLPGKPKPPKVIGKTLVTWGFTDSNDSTMLRVLKRVGLLSDSGETTSVYAAFMRRDTGPQALGDRVREVYQQLFEHVTNPSQASTEDLTNFFNINSGGSGSSIGFQVNTFKALAEYSRFDGPAPVDARVEQVEVGSAPLSQVSSPTAQFHIDLHVHLPENKSRNDYDAIFESIANHLLGRSSQ